MTSRAAYKQGDVARAVRAIFQATGLQADNCEIKVLPDGTVSVLPKGAASADATSPESVSWALARARRNGGHAA
jgi:hypothetical protein